MRARDAGMDASESPHDASMEDAPSIADDAPSIADAADVGPRVDGGVEPDAGIGDAGLDAGCRCACTWGGSSTVGAPTALLSSLRMVSRPGGLALAWMDEADDHVHLALGGADGDARSVAESDVGALGVQPSVAVAADQLAVSTRGGTGATITTQRFDAARAPVGAAGVLSTRATRAIALVGRDDGRFAIAWVGDGAVSLASLDGEAQETARARLADVGDRSPGLAAARALDRTLVAWSDEEMVWTVVVGDDGRLGGAVPLTEMGTNDRIRALSASYAAPGFAVAWVADVVDDADVFVDEGEQVVVARLGVDGRPAGRPVEVARDVDVAAVWPTVAAAASELGVVVAWGDRAEVVLARLSVDLEVFGAPARAAALDDVDEIAAAAVEGGFAVAWTGGHTGLGLARFDCLE